MYILSSTTKASNFVTGVDNAFMLILGISFFFLIGLTLTMLYFIYKYNNKKHPVAVRRHGIKAVGSANGVQKSTFSKKENVLN